MKLCIFDFDQTLLRSPIVPSELYNQSLEPPYLPTTPDSSYWISEVVSQARQALQDPSCYAILATGRAPRFKPRILQLLAQVGLDFKGRIYCTPDEINTCKFKSQVFTQKMETLLYFKRLHSVSFWDDRLDYLQEYKKLAIKFNLPYTVYHVDTNVIRI